MRKSPKPTLCFQYSKKLHSKSLKLLDAIDEAEDATQYRDELGDLVVEFTDTGMDYFFLKPLQVAKVGFLVQQSANLGMAGALTMLGSVIRGVIGRLDETQVKIIAKYFRKLMG